MFLSNVNTTFVDWTNLLNALQMNVYYFSDFIHGSIIIIPFGFYHICKNVVIPRGTSYKQALGEDCTTVITTTVHIPGHLLQRCSEQLIRSCVFWEANVWSSSRTNKRTRIENTLFEVCLRTNKGTSIKNTLFEFEFKFECLVFNAAFSNISAISWRPVSVVEEARVPGENHLPWASNW